MSTLERPVVVGVFKEEDKAKSTIAVLREAGFNDDQLEFAVSGVGLANDGIFDNLVSMGVPEEEVNYYRREFEAGHSLVSVRHDGRHWEAVNILYGGRVHRYLNFKRNEMPVSFTKGLEDQNEVFRSFLSSIVPEEHRPQAVEETSAETTPSWQKLLMDAGLDRLFDRLS